MVSVSKITNAVVTQESSVTGKWNTGTATSGSTGADLVSIGAANRKYKIHSLLVDISSLTNNATITIRMYMKINGVEKRVFPPIALSQTFVVGTDADGIWVINGMLVIDQILRVEVMSDNSSDDNLAVAYKYNSEAL